MRRKSRKPENNGIAAAEDDQTNEKDANGTHNNDDVSDTSEPEPKKRKSGKKASPKKAAKDDKKVQEEEQDEESEEEDYEVESIVDQRTVKGITQYLIKWKGYDSSSNTWEIEESVNCPDLLKEFLENNKKSPKAKKSPGKKGPKPKISKKEPTPDWDENEDFEVDRIIEVHHKRKGGKEFLVSWKGYPPSQNSWVDEEDMDCKDLVAKFMDKVSKAKTSEQKDLRIDRKPTDRFTLNTRDTGRRLSRRNVGKQRVHYHDAE